MPDIYHDPSEVFDIFESIHPGESILLADDFTGIEIHATLEPSGFPCIEVYCDGALIDETSFVPNADLCEQTVEEIYDKYLTPEVFNLLPELSGLSGDPYDIMDEPHVPDCDRPYDDEVQEIAEREVELEDAIGDLMCTVFDLPEVSMTEIELAKDEVIDLLASLFPEKEIFRPTLFEAYGTTELVRYPYSA